MHEISDRDSALAFLMGRINYERTGSVPYRANQLKLDRMAKLLGKLGDPHLSCPTIHIAGTKGKGSTATLTASILRSAGLRTGLYCSPHLERLEERFTVDGQQCDSAAFARLVARIADVVAEMDAESASENENGPTFFEVTTALAWMVFAERRVDCAAVEVGLGGRLDSTNVCAPTMTAITSISLDHTRQLGNQISSIAREKAGIIKPGVPVVVGPLEDEPAAVIDSIAIERGSAVHRFGDAFQVQPCVSESSPRFDYFSAKQELRGLEIQLLGRHQIQNAGAAIFLASGFCERTGRGLSAQAIRDGLRAARCPARVELLSERPYVVLDAAHNPASAAALCTALESLPVERSRRTLVFATSRDKDARSMMRVLRPCFGSIVLTRFTSNPRALDPAELAARWPKSSNCDVHVEPDPERAWGKAFEACGEDGLICVAGSFFLAAELRGLMQAAVARAS